MRNTYKYLLSYCCLVMKITLVCMIHRWQPGTFSWEKKLFLSALFVKFYSDLHSHAISCIMVFRACLWSISFENEFLLFCVTLGKLHQLCFPLLHLQLE